MKSIIWTSLLIIALLVGAGVAYAGGYLDPLLGERGVTAAPVQAPDAQTTTVAQSTDVGDATALMDNLVPALGALAATLFGRHWLFDWS